MSETQFDKHKADCLAGLDLSRKGSIDTQISDLVQYINSLEDYFTTSSCSGRIMVFQKDDSCDIQKKGCQWLYTTHEEAEVQPILECVEKSDGNAVFKFEPFVLHVQCRSIQNAQKLHSVAIASGFRNSGISIGGKGKIITAVRSTHSLEVPLSHKGEILVSEKYIEYLVQLANEKLQENITRIYRFHDNLTDMVTAPNKQQIKNEKRQLRKELKQKMDRMKNENKIKTPNSDSNSDESDFNLVCFNDT